jgi:hypothetical protein
VEVLFTALGATKPKKKKPKPTEIREASISEAIGLLFYGVYALPALAGYGKHWYLSEEEQALIGEQGEAAIASLPDSQAAKVAALIKKYAPAVNLISTLGITAWERAKLTKQMMEAARVQAAEARGETPRTGNGAPPIRERAPGAGAETERPRAPRSSLTELFERGDE